MKRISSTEPTVVRRLARARGRGGRRCDDEGDFRIFGNPSKEWR